jgi:hypothetical protein
VTTVRFLARAAAAKDENVGTSGAGRSADCEKKLGMFDGNSGVVGDDRQ